jgi:predicted nucleotidyltransferase
MLDLLVKRKILGMGSPENRIENLTQRSIESLHIVNAIRDYLHLYGSLLEKIGLEQVLVYGSVVRGEAQVSSEKRQGEPSDIDLVFLLARANLGIEGEKEYRQNRELARKFANGLEKHIKSDVKINSVMSSVNEAGNYPYIVKDPLPLWETSQKPKKIALPKSSFSSPHVLRVAYQGIRGTS